MLARRTFAILVFAIMLTVSTRLMFGQEREATLGVLAIWTEESHQVALVENLGEKDPKTLYPYLYRIACEKTCPMEMGLTYPATIVGTHSVSRITVNGYKITLDFLGSGAPLTTDGRTYECDPQLEGGHMEWNSSKSRLECKAGRKDHIKWKAAKQIAKYTPCDEQLGFSNMTLNVVITVKPEADKTWKFPEAPAVVAARVLQGLNGNARNIKFIEANGVTPNLYLAVTLSETNEGTRQDAASVEATGLGKTGILFTESSGDASFTTWVAATDKLSANMHKWFENGWSKPAPCIRSDGSVRTQ